MIILGLGSNWGDRRSNLQTALIALQTAGIALSKVSSVYETPALLPANAPPEWDIPYYNIVCSIGTGLSPLDLLQAAKIIETTMGRRDVGRWGPRIIDIDILAYNNEIISSEILDIPHKDMLLRDFVMVPLLEIIPDWQHPALNRYEPPIHPDVQKTDIRLEWNHA